MEIKLLEEIEKRLLNGESAALVTVTESLGSTPRKSGSLMAVFNDGILGSIGGGTVEFKVISKSRELLESGISENFEFGMAPDDELKLACGGHVKGFIKIFKPSNNLIIIGAGHIGKELTYIAKHLDFNITVLDDRFDYTEISETKVIVGDVVGNIRKLNYGKNTFVVIASRGHSVDLEALREFIKEDVKYIGMVGSKSKVLQVTEKLLNEGIDEKYFEKLYSPIGLDFSDGTPAEIAIEIFSEILMIKNNGNLRHRRIEIKK